MQQRVNRDEKGGERRTYERQNENETENVKEGQGRKFLVLLPLLIGGQEHRISIRDTRITYLDHGLAMTEGR